MGAAEKKAKEEAEALARNQSLCRWRQTGGCSPDGALEPTNDKFCDETIGAGVSGYCDCDGDSIKGANEPGFDCKGASKVCNDLCPKEGGDAQAPEAASDAQAPDAAAAETEEEKPVSEYAKWMDGAESTLGEGEQPKEDAQVSEYAKWMDGAESTLSKEGADDAAAAAPEA